MSTIILSVIFNNYEVYLNNYECILEQNKNEDIIFMVVDNSSLIIKESVHYLKSLNNVVYIKNDVLPSYTFKRNSFHHAIALDVGINFIKLNKFTHKKLIVMDPDYFVFGNEWISFLSKKMDDNHLCFLGSPWGLAWGRKYKNFPCVQFMMLGVHKINNFPTFAPVDVSNSTKFLIWRILYANRYVSHFVTKFLDHVVDTGSEIYYSYYGAKIFLFKETTRMRYETGVFMKIKAVSEWVYHHAELNKDCIELFDFEGGFTMHFRSFGNAINYKG
jgi:hypothetical protein